MGKHGRCCVGGCNNDKRYSDKYVIRSHVTDLKFHIIPSDLNKRQIWEKQIGKGRKGFQIGKSMHVCSNHFQDAKPTSTNPFPTLFLTESDSKKKSPVKRKCRKSSEPTPSKKLLKGQASGCQESSALTAGTLTFAQLTRESDVKFYTGFKSTDMFRLVFSFLSIKAINMRYWKGGKQTQLETHGTDPYLKPGDYNRPGPNRKLTLEQEFLLVMMRLRVGLLVPDLAFRFNVSTGLISSIFTTWIKLMRKELGWLIIWPTRPDTRKSLPECFKKWFPKVRCIIDCTEFFIETPSSLDAQAMCWSEYKHHCTIKVLISITPTGMISFVSDCYGGRASDKYIVQNSGFYNFIEPYDQIMADRGFKIKEELLQRQASLSIPPSKQGTLPMTTGDVQETSRIANVRIYVEKAIARVKWYNILAKELEITCLPLCDDIVICCCALCNLLEPLCI